MPYKNKEKQKEANRIAQKKHRESIRKYTDIEAPDGVRFKIENKELEKMGQHYNPENGHIDEISMLDFLINHTGAKVIGYWECKQ